MTQSTTSCASTASAARTSAPAALRRTFALADGYGRLPEVLAGMMSGDDVAAVVGPLRLTRPRNHRILETALRPMTEPSWG